MVSGPVTVSESFSQVPELLPSLSHESMFPPRIREDLHAKRDYHNAKLNEYCDRGGIQLADICSRLRDEHFADELHPNGAGARIIAKAVFETLRPVYET